MKRIDLQRALWHIVSFTVKLAALKVLLSTGLFAQSVELHSEFWPLHGAPVPAREIISPAVPRNAWTTFQVLVTAPPGTSYFLFCQTNPPGLVDTRLYKRMPGDKLEMVRTPNFGVIPDKETSRAYVLDIWVPADADVGRRVRLELQLKIGDWIVYPLELRIQKASVPLVKPDGEVAPSFQAMLDRNRKQDLAFEQMLNLPEVWFLTAQHIANGWTWASPLSAAEDPEWYLKVRDLMYRHANSR
jgi:hypothetical protein